MPEPEKEYILTRILKEEAEEICTLEIRKQIWRKLILAINSENKKVNPKDKV